MSYSIIIYKKDGKKEEIPFSTNKNFDDNWIPIIKELDLFLINEFQFGVDIGSMELTELLDEFKKAKTYHSISESLIERIDYLETRLVDIKVENNFNKIFLG